MRAVSLPGVLFTALAMSAGATDQTRSPQTLRTGVELIEVTVVVSDAQGGHVGALTRDDFQITEDGTAQTIAAFEHVAIPIVAAREADDESAGHVQPAPPKAPGEHERDVTTNEVGPAARLFVIVLDPLHTDSRRTLDVRRHATTFIEKHLGAADLAAVVSPGGGAEAMQEFTGDKARLIRAVEGFTGQKLPSASVQREEDKHTGVSALRDGRDPSDSERAYRAIAVANTLEALARSLDGVEHRRKAVLLFSEGVDYNVNDVMGKVQQHASDVARAMEHAVAALAHANVAVYAIDSRGLTSGEGTLVETPIFQTAPPTDISEPGVQGEVGASIRSLRRIAEQTGGFAAVDRNDFTGAFERIIRESSDYYVLAYTPLRPARPGESRRIDVRVSRPGLRVMARKGYVVPAAEGRRPGPASAPPEPAAPRTAGRTMGAASRAGFAEKDAPVARPGVLADEMSSLLAGLLPRPGLPMRVDTIAFRNDGRKTAVTIVIEVLAPGLSFGENGGRFEERIELAMMTIDSSGRAANGRSAALGLRLTPLEIDGVRTTGVRWVSRLDLTPGRYQLRVAGRAGRSGKTGMVIHEIDVPRFERGTLGMSGISLTSLPAVLMVTRGDGKLPAKLRTPPSTMRTFVPRDKLTAVVELYVPASGENVDVTTRVETAGGVLKMGAAERVPGRAAAGQAAQEEVAFAIPLDSLTPGEYVLRISAQPVNGADRIERSVAFAVVNPIRTR
jgi:VWFA-related protein